MLRKENAYNAYISFDWGIPPHYQTFQVVEDLHKELKKTGVQTYFDYDRTNKNLVQMENAIDDSAVFLIFVTKK